MSSRKVRLNMEMVIERILSVQDGDNTFLKMQQKRLQELQSMQKCKKQKKIADSRKAIIDELKSSGILDKNGNLASPYSGD